MRIEIISTKTENTISINLNTFEVTQIIRFPSGNFYKQTYQNKTLTEARMWANTLR